jgi:hypothetical protein
MAGSQSPLVQELSNLYEALCFDLPAEATKTLFGMENDKELQKAGWKAYDAWIGVANEFTNLAYSNRLIGEITGRTMDSALRLREVSATMASAFFGNLWPALGLPTQSELLMVRDELIALRDELAAREAAGQSPAPHPTSGVPNTDERLRAVWRRVRDDASPPLNGNAGAFRPSRERKGHAVA